MFRMFAASSLLALGLIVIADAQEKKDPKKEPAGNPSTKLLNRDVGRHKLFLKRIEETKGEGDVVFIGDSITEAWEGGGGKLWKEHFGAFKPVNLGISGDQTGHVLWRLTEGKELANLKPKAAVIMIGTNNTGGNAQIAENIAGGIKAIIDELKKQKPDIKILLLAVFPRGNKGDADATTKVIPAEKLASHPQNKKITAINEIIAKYADGKSVFFKDIGKEFLTKEGGLSLDVMPDALHLSQKGYDIWGKAIKDDVAKLLK